MTPAEEIMIFVELTTRAYHRGIIDENEALLRIYRMIQEHASDLLIPGLLGTDKPRITAEQINKLLE